MIIWTIPLNSSLNSFEPKVGVTNVSNGLGLGFSLTLGCIYELTNERQTITKKLPHCVPIIIKAFPDFHKLSWGSPTYPEFCKMCVCFFPKCSQVFRGLRQQTVKVGFGKIDSSDQMA